jgi:hypothetical protein
MVERRHIRLLENPAYLYCDLVLLPFSMPLLGLQDTLVALARTLNALRLPSKVLQSRTLCPSRTYDKTSLYPRTLSLNAEDSGPSASMQSLLRWLSPASYDVTGWYRI